jgi:hypothetical protein
MPSFSLLRPAPPPPENTPSMLALPPLAIYPSRDALLEAIQAWAKLGGAPIS